ncbi:site-specific integrase [Methylobacterium brachiatum]|uniref:Site-specific integrase n=1 Tax=Methylobacterium brachiatum TaxID=269660 RepID=A0ABV1R6S3_9HYPH
MANIRKRGRAWQVQIRRDGFPPITKSFRSKADADHWAREAERQIERGELSSQARTAKGLTIGALLQRYEAEITSGKRGQKFEASRIRTFLRSSLARVAAHRLTPSMVAAYRDDRLKSVKGDTVRRELTVLRHCIEVARKEWGAPFIGNPVRQTTLPSPSKVRGQRLPEGAEASLMAALSGTRVWYLKPLITLALETGMRRGELLALEWSSIDIGARLAHLRTSKNGYERSVPLTPKAIATLGDILVRGRLIFPVKANAVRLAWERLRRRAGIEQVKFHSMRHEAISRMFEVGLTIPEVSVVSGHKTLSCLQRYTHLKPENVAAKLAQLSAQSN